MTDMWDFDSLSSESITAEQNLANPGSANALVAQVLADSVGATPTIEPPGDTYVSLPGGLYWEGELLRTAEVRELTGEDEEKLAAVKGSIARWLSVLLERAVVRIGDEKATPQLIRKALIGDRDALLLGVRIATFGRDITVRGVRCPHCDGVFDATVDLSAIERVELDDPNPRHQYTVPLRRGSALVQLPDGAAQEAMFKLDDITVAERNTVLLSHCLVRVVAEDGEAKPGKGEVLARSLSMADRQRVIQFIAETQPGPKLDDIRFAHDACGEEVRLPLELPELFRID